MLSLISLFLIILSISYSNKLDILNDYLSKPIDSTATLNCIARWTSGRNSYAPAPSSTTAPTEEKTDDYLDESVLEQLVRDTSPEIIPKLLTIYMDDAQNRLQIIQTALSENDIKSLEYESHTLGSSSAAHGNIRLHNLARKVEHLCQDGKEKEAIELAKTLPAVTATSLQQLSEYAKNFSGEKALEEQ